MSRELESLFKSNGKAGSNGDEADNSKDCVRETDDG